jgi:hypothetical protein
MDGNRSKFALLAAVSVLAVLITACGGSGGDAQEDESEAMALAGVQNGPVLSSSLCLACHSQPVTTSPLAFGRVKELQAVAPDAFYNSAHSELSCVDCHEDQTALPHDDFDRAGAPILSPDPSAVCRSCHGGPAEHFLDSVHGTVIRLGDDRAPGCTDCHSAHAVQRIGTWAATERAEACVRCHEDADATFAGSLTHVEPTVSRLPIDYVATRFFGALVVAVVGIGILHVELDMLRWLRGKLGRKSREDK